MFLTAEQLRPFAAAVEDVLPVALNDVRRKHPLLTRATMTNLRQIEVEADVDAGQLAIATYEIPLISSGVSLTLDPSMGSSDQLIRFAREIIAPTVRDYERSLRCGMYDPRYGFLGVGGLLPSEVGTNVIAGIDEAVNPGWQSQVTQAYADPYLSFVVSEARCMRDGQAPDLTILGTNAYRDLVSTIQPQQRFRTVSGGISTLLLHSGAIFHDPFCATDTGYMVHSSDFSFYASPFKVVAQVGLDARVRVVVRRREQMVSSRRYRSGTITPATPFSDEGFIARRR